MASLQSTMKAFENLGRVLDEENLVNFVLRYMKQRQKSVATLGA